jgi:lipoprotein-releasing system ATP-binding protein
MSAPVIEVRLVTRILQEAASPVVLVRDVSFRVFSGEFVAILGPSGCGKSSLLYLMGLLDRPSQGEILIDGRSTATMTSDALTALRLQKIGFVFQFHFLLPEFTALENVSLPMRKLGRLRRGEIDARALRLLSDLGLEGNAGKRPDKMSGGQRQRVAIARCLANDPELLLCDEPTGNLDSGNTKVVIETFQKLAHQERRTIVCVTHDETVAAAADRRVRMVDGAIVDDDGA